MPDYKFPVYWTDKLKINFLQRVVLIHSYLYYELDNPVWSDMLFDCVSRQLARMQDKHDGKWIKNKTQYGYCFYDFDGTTGFDLWGRLKVEDREIIQRITKGIVKNGK